MGRGVRAEKKRDGTEHIPEPCTRKPSTQTRTRHHAHKQTPIRRSPGQVLPSPCGPDASKSLWGTDNRRLSEKHLTHLIIAKKSRVLGANGSEPLADSRLPRYTYRKNMPMIASWMQAPGSLQRLTSWPAFNFFVFSSGDMCFS